MKQILFISTILLQTLLFGQHTNSSSVEKTDSIKMSQSDVSECLTNCEIVTGVISQQLIGDALTLKLGAEMNCSVNSKTEIDFEFYSDTLNLIIPQFQIVRDTIVSKTDSTHTITISEKKEHALCNCYFHIDLVLENCRRSPDIILINGQAIKEN